MTINVRPACSQDTYYLSENPPYSKHRHDYSNSLEDTFVAENEEKVLGAVSASNKNIQVVYGDWKYDFEWEVRKLTKEISGAWISKLYVFP